ncbi:MAG: flagellar basal body rod protein FlgB [Planctomycetes bacterium]|nr:flagellar basal body rod protein FlgB [Planctomycetota bacterium]
MDQIRKGNELLSRLLTATALRERVLAENVANQNVPGYKRREVTFEEALRARVQAKSPHADVKPLIRVDQQAPMGPDGNTVSLELETSAMRENRLAYELYATMLQSRLAMAQVSITESR